ncbi:type IV pilus secretin PilQ [Desulfurobacterium atlanticum]|uniref:Type IV pilus assembly protein PilQ n=1 Tax=Desulfurobacterium atlanticum TaxID=240169 RepID=A0A238Z6I3_9BACT|nr:type IV pilus secretin PilQ [Desulfurobacterium atlanticum]SNR78578.1 type IV pilus assembly protein PilQ [Desulfurobacterium atlanticum]
MRKLINTLTILTVLASPSFAAKITDINLLNINGKLRLVLKTDGNCQVKEKKNEGSYNFFLEGCIADKRKVYGYRDDLIKIIDIVPLENGTEVKIVPVNKINVSYTVFPKATTFVIASPTFAMFKTYETHDSFIIDTGTNVPFKFKKSGRQIVFSSDTAVLKESEKLLNSRFVDKIKTYSTGKKSYIVVLLKKDFPVQVLNRGSKYEIKFLSPSQKKVADGVQGKIINENIETKKIKLDFTNADVRTVVRAIADIVGLNVVFDPEVKGTVFIRFLTPVSWEEALKAVVEPLGFTYIKKKDYIRIASKQKILEELATEPIHTYIVPLNYAYAQEVAKIIEKYLNAEEKKGKKLNTRELVEVDERTNSLILKVTKSHYEKIMEIIKHTDKMTRQVSIEAKIVLVDTSLEKQLGVNWSLAAWGSGSNLYKAGSFQANDAVTIPGVATGSIGNAATMPSQPYTLAVGILKKDQSLRAELAIKASELTGNGKLVSQPKVVTLDNKEATIEQGMEIPYKVIDENGNISTEFKKASLILKVKPHVTNDNKIMLDLEIKKDKPNYDYVAITGNTEPAIDTRNVKTQIMVNNGDTLVIGGIYEQEKSKSKAGVPLLSKIPLLGWLFKNEVVKNSNSQLLIFITPKVISSEGSGGEG